MTRRQTDGGGRGIPVQRSGGTYVRARSFTLTYMKRPAVRHGTRSCSVVPEVDLLPEAGCVRCVLVTAVHLVHTVVVGIPVAGPAGPL